MEKTTLFPSFKPVQNPLLSYVPLWQVEMSIRPYFKWSDHPSKPFHVDMSTHGGATSALTVFVGIYMDRGGNMDDITEYLEIGSQSVKWHVARYKRARTGKHFISRMIMARAAKVNRHINSHYVFKRI